MTASGTVYVLQYTHKHGDDFTAWPSQQEAESALAGIVREWWAAEMKGEDGVPATPDDLSDEDAVRMYFDHTSETAEIHELLIGSANY